MIASARPRRRRAATSRHAAQAEHHASGEKSTRWRNEIERREPETAGGAEAPALVREDADEEVGDADRPVAIEAACGAVPREERVAAERRWLGSTNERRELGGVAQAEIEPLPRDRMQRLSRVADRDRARARDVGPSEREPQPDARARPSGHEAAEPMADLCAERCEEVLTARLEQALRAIRSHRPDERVALLRVGKQRERPVRREALKGGATLHDLGSHSRHDRRLSVIAHREIIAADLPAIGEHEQPRRDLARTGSARDARVDAIAGHLPGNEFPGEALGRRRFREHRVERAAIADVSERGHAEILAPDQRAAEPARLGHVDRLDRRHREPLEDADLLKEWPAAVREGDRSEFGSPWARVRLDESHVEPRRAEGERERGADWPGAADKDVDVQADPRSAFLPFSLESGALRWRSRMRASTSSTRFGAPSVRISQPAAVTSASSSMRTPMFQKRSGTPSPGRT